MPVSSQFSRYVDIYERDVDGDYFIERERSEFEAQLLSRLKDLSKGQRTMLMVIIRVYDRLVKERSAPRGEVRAWVSRADIARELKRWQLYRYHINQINRLKENGLIEVRRRARLSERENWLGETVQKASGYELVYRPRPDVSAALKNVERKRAAASQPPKPVEPKPKPHNPQNDYEAMLDRYARLSKRSWLDRLRDWLPL